MDADLIKCLIVIGLEGNPGIARVVNSFGDIAVRSSDGRKFSVSVREEEKE